MTTGHNYYIVVGRDAQSEGLGVTTNVLIVG